MKFLTFLLFFAFFAIKSEIFIESASCQYSEKTVYIYFVMLKSYSCDISLDNLGSYENVESDHEYGKSDGDVKILQSSSPGELEQFSSSFCQQFPNIEAVELENITINLIDGNSLENCRNLKLLVFNSNNIPEIPENLLSENTKLLEIEISSNQLQSLAERTFERQINLKRLTLNNNIIKSLPSGIFRNLKNLERLHLNNNQIRTLNRKWFEGLLKLEKLTLNSNKISDLPEKIFTDLKKIQILELNSNYLTVINANSFGNQGNLMAVFLNFNNIEAIDQRFIQSSPISIMSMEGNDCFNKNIQQRHSMDESLKGCYENFAQILDTTTEPTTTTTVEPTTTTTRRTTTTTTEPSTTKPTTTTTFPYAPGNLETTSRPNKDRIRNFPPGAYPWIAAILTQHSSYLCGGVLVSERKVVTVARSMFNREEKIPTRDIIVILGSHLLYDAYESGRSVQAVYRIRMHPEFDIYSNSNHANIAVIILDLELNLNSNSMKRIKPIIFMNLSYDVMSVTNMFHASYGSRETLEGKIKSPPKEIRSSILEDKDCPASVEDQSFCIGEDRESAICIDDVGSGVFVNHNGKYYLRGIVTNVRLSSNGLCSSSAYSLITDISKVNQWIEEAPIEDPVDLEDRFGRPIWRS